MGRQIDRRKIKALCGIESYSSQLQFKAALGEFHFSQQCKVTLLLSADHNEKYWKGLEWSWNKEYAAAFTEFK